MKNGNPHGTRTFCPDVSPQRILLYIFPWKIPHFPTKISSVTNHPVISPQRIPPGHSLIDYSATVSWASQPMGCLFVRSIWTRLLWVYLQSAAADRVQNKHVSSWYKATNQLLMSCLRLLVLDVFHLVPLDILQPTPGTLYHSISAIVTLPLLLTVDWMYYFLIKPLPGKNKPIKERGVAENTNTSKFTISKWLIWFQKQRRLAYLV